MEESEFEAIRSVLLIDDSQSFSNDMIRSFSELDNSYTLRRATTFPDAVDAVELCKPQLVISELRVGGRLLFEFLPRLDRLSSLNRVAVATSYPSVATAVRLTRMGVAAYFTKPVSAKAILAELTSGWRGNGGGNLEDLQSWPSLDRTIWEYLNQVYVSAGSMAEAARQLGLDRRSLRRMLAKYPPVR